MTGRSFFPDFGDERAVDDIARAPDDAIQLFVQTAAARPFMDESSRAMCVYGPKGSGKTLALWRKRLQVSRRPGVLVSPPLPESAHRPSADFAATVRFTQYYQLEGPGSSGAAVWQSLWEWALLRSIAAEWVFRGAGSQAPAVEGIRTCLEGDYQSVPRIGGGESENPFDLLHGFFANIEQWAHRNRLRIPGTVGLRNAVKRGADASPPTYLFIDNQDDFYEENPEFWIGSSLGCIGAAADIRAYTNHRVHFFISLRPEVLYRLRRSERYSTLGTQLVELHWRDAELVEFFCRRIKALRADRLQSPELVERQPLTALLGRMLLRSGGSEPEIHNKRIARPGQRIAEPASSYLLRHTLRRPRDLIVVGNRILRGLSGPAAPDTRQHAMAVREAVAEGAKEIAIGYLNEVQRRWPWRDTPGCGLHQFVLNFIDRNVLTREAADRITGRFREASGDPAADPFSVLMCLGLVGYPNRTGKSGDLVQVFQNPGCIDIESVIPDTAGFILVHPTLYSENIEPVRGLAIGPNMIFDEARLDGLAEATRPGAGGAAASGGPAVPQGSAAVVPTASQVVWSWLHLSDLHFGAGGVGHGADRENVTERLVVDIVEQGRRVDAIFVTGDITFSATEAQFEQARAWLGQVAQAAGVAPDRVFMVPGNHDVQRDQVARNPSLKALHDTARLRPGRLDEQLAHAATRRTLESKLTHYLGFLERFHAPALTPEPAPGGLDWRHEDDLGARGGGTVRIVGLSTVWASDEDDGRGDVGIFQPNMILGEQQLREGLGSLGPGDLLVLLTHHPLEWLHPRSRRLLGRFMAQPMCIHLCGHVHRAQAESSQEFFSPTEVVTFTAGAAHGEQGDIEPHTYSFGAIRRSPEGGLYEVGYCPRVFLDDRNTFGRARGIDDPQGYRWRAVPSLWKGR